MGAIRTRRGFTMTEVAVVLAIMGLLMVIFVATRGSSTTSATTVAAEGAASSAADAVVAAYRAAGTTDAPNCAQVPPGSTAMNAHAFANPCTLAQTGTTTRFVAAGSPSDNQSTVSVAEQSTTQGYDVTLTVEQSGDRDTPASRCIVLVRPLPAGTEQHYTFPAPATGCAASDAQATIAAGSGQCPAGSTASWQQACALPPRQ